MSVIYHIAPRADWERAQDLGAYAAESLQTEGFIHCSTASQHADTADRLFAGRRDLVLLLVDTASLSSEVVVENGFPHIYGPIDPDAVFEVSAFEPGPDGRFVQHDHAVGFDAFGDKSLDEMKALVVAGMEGFGAPWWVAGAWAIDLHTGRRTRPHSDVEISVLGVDEHTLYEHVQSWDPHLTGAGDGAFPAWHGGPIPAPYHQVWTRRRASDDERWQAFAADPTHVDFLIEDGDRERWIYRRRHDVSLPLERFGRVTADGVPYVGPEVALLYKSKALRYKDERDFKAVRQDLDAEAREWLAGTLDVTTPDHPWLKDLR